MGGGWKENLVGWMDGQEGGGKISEARLVRAQSQAPGDKQRLGHVTRVEGRGRPDDSRLRSKLPHVDGTMTGVNAEAADRQPTVATRGGGKRRMNEKTEGGRWRFDALSCASMSSFCVIFMTIS